ncbi:MAG TPA: DUF58 domain-containing protein [Actinomycetes bacterium]|nr:DUF58 domain-containing protein [Actinomycetes bacterium]
MRAALAGLTTRGRALVAAGGTAFFLALAFGQRDVMRVGVLMAALPLLAMLSVARTRFRLSSQRTVEPARVSTGQTASVVLALENVAPLPTGLLLVEDQVPAQLGVRPRFVIDRLAPRSVRRVQFTVRSELRGRFMLGPLSVRLTDPFGFCRLDRSFSTQHQLLVTPQTEDLPNVILRGDWSGSGDSRSRSVAAAGEDDVAVREYRHGDELRRVHWRATAKNGSLMVRREEQPWESRCTVLLDTRLGGHRGTGADSSFERTVSAAASVSLHLSRRAYAVRLVTGTGPEISGARDPDYSGGGADAEGLLLDALAVVTCERRLATAALAHAIRHTSDGLLLAVTGHLTPEDADELVRARLGMGTSIALVCAAEEWSDNDQGDAELAQQREHAIRLLRSAGWVVATLKRRDLLSETWSHLAHGSDLDLDLPPSPDSSLASPSTSSLFPSNVTVMP